MMLTTIRAVSHRVASRLRAACVWVCSGEGEEEEKFELFEDPLELALSFDEECNTT